MELTLPDILPFPLYHGTSSIWREAIEARGLGGRKIVEEFRAVECLRDIISMLEELPSDQRPDQSTLNAFGSLASQSVTEAGLNFRHGGGVYLSPSGYSGRLCGSELLWLRDNI